MNREDILKMEAGREMDLLVAEKVMGMSPPEGKTHGSCCYCQTCGYAHDECVCGYSESIEMAWEVVKEMSAKNFWCVMEVLSSRSVVMFEEAKTMEKYEAYANPYDLPLAICRAALLATLKG